MYVYPVSKVLNPHGSDETCGVRNAYVEFDEFLTHTVQMKPISMLKEVTDTFLVLNPHGSDETQIAL